MRKVILLGGLIIMANISAKDLARALAEELVRESPGPRPLSQREIDRIQMQPRFSAMPPDSGGVPELGAGRTPIPRIDYSNPYPEGRSADEIEAWLRDYVETYGMEGPEPRPGHW